MRKSSFASQPGPPVILKGTTNLALTNAAYANFQSGRARSKTEERRELQKGRNFTATLAGCGAEEREGSYVWRPACLAGHASDDAAALWEHAVQEGDETIN